MAKIDGRYAAAQRDTAHIIKYMRKNAFKKENGARAEASNIAVIVLDRKSLNEEDTITESQKAKEELGLNIIVVKVGDDVTTEEAELIASSPAHILSVRSYDDLPSLAAQLTQMINDVCDGKFTKIAILIS